MKHSRLESFENAVTEMDATVQAVLFFGVGVLMGSALFWGGSTVSAFLRGVLP